MNRHEYFLKTSVSRQTLQNFSWLVIHKTPISCKMKFVSSIIDVFNLGLLAQLDQKGSSCICCCTLCCTLCDVGRRLRINPLAEKDTVTNKKFSLVT